MARTFPSTVRPRRDDLHAGSHQFDMWYTQMVLCSFPDLQQLQLSRRVVWVDSLKLCVDSPH